MEQTSSAKKPFGGSSNRLCKYILGIVASANVFRCREQKACMNSTNGEIDLWQVSIIVSKRESICPMKESLSNYW
jgi:hypothetical protein